MELRCRRKEENHKGRFIDLVKEDMQRVGVMEEDAWDRERWKQIMKTPKRQTVKNPKKSN